MFFLATEWEVRAACDIITEKDFSFSFALTSEETIDTGRYFPLTEQSHNQKRSL